MEVHTSNPVIQEVEARSSGNPQLHSELEASTHCNEMVPQNKESKTSEI